MNEPIFECDCLIVLSAFRYALGRQTYMVKHVADYLKTNWSKLSSSHQELIVREITCAIEQGHAGSKIDEDSWRSVLAFANVVRNTAIKEIKNDSLKS